VKTRLQNGFATGNTFRETEIHIIFITYQFHCYCPHVVKN